ncbi:PAS domain-containing protein [Ramlibacter sp. AW1]|uniref:histidine kinase n=1 Tax=Ramlibacter aurantiacus TaxID=2801330 RepID=A0A936ZEZ4_9BURK|nr:PAS domain-containing protein [Ramlibacter aurantiacus]MBL0419053.1 PAS domain-containing protein [Ramlibacter aurantiacus]
MSPTHPSAVPAGLFHGGSEIAGRLAEFAWHDHPLGPAAEWPASLQSLVRSMLRSRGPMFICWGPEARLLYNDAYAAILRDKHPQALGRPFRDVWSEVGPELDGMLERIRSGEGIQGTDTPFRVLRDGREQVASFSFVWNPVVTDDGQVPGFYCIAFETTLAVEAEQARAEEAERLIRMFDEAPGFLAVLSGPDHIFRQANRAYRSFVGRRGEIVGRPVREVAPAAIEQGWGAVLDEVLRTGKPYVGEASPVRLSPEGREAEERLVDFILQPMRGRDGAVEGILIQGSDVTEHKRTLERLRESELRFRTIADAMPQMVWSARPDGFHDYFNQRWYEFTGVPQGVTDGHAWNDVFHPEDQARARERWQRSLETGATYEIEYRLRHHTGVFRWVLGRAVALRDDSGTISRWMGTCTDIHEQFLAREILREEDRRKDEFLAMLAHELRNPLAPIASGVTLLHRVAGNEARVRQTADLIGRQAAHLRSLVDDLMDVSGVARGLVTLAADQVDLRQVLADAVEQTRPLMDGKRHSLHIMAGSAPLPVEGDRKRLVQIFANVLGNAAKYTPPSGRVVVETGIEDDSAVVRVIDNGLGMTPELLERVFDLFVQGERAQDHAQGGLGIGLALVRRLVELHGGSVSASSMGPGHGSTFTVRLPAAQTLPEPHAPAAHDGPQVAPPTRVLVVDDNRDSGQVLAMLLEEMGYEAYVEATVARALATAAHVRPHVCLLDVRLPDGNGRELAAQLVRLPGMQSAALAVISGFGQYDELAASRDAGMEHFVKPVDPDALGKWLQGLGA